MAQKTIFAPNPGKIKVPPLKIGAQSNFEDVENSEFHYFFGENFRFKALHLSEKSSESYVLHILTLSEPSAIRQ